MRRLRGAVNLVQLTLFVTVISGAYLGWLYVPLMLDDLDVRETLAAGVGQLVAEVGPLNPTDAQKFVAGRLARVGTHWEDEDGKKVEVPGLGVGPEDVEVERSPDGRTGRISVDYARTVKLKPLEKYWIFRFHTSREASLKP